MKAARLDQKMARSGIFGSVVGISILLLGAATADASPYTTNGFTTNTPYAFGTSSTVPAAVGTRIFANTINQDGGLCQISTGNTDGCATGAGVTHTTGTLTQASSTGSAGVIELYSPSPVANYIFDITITQYAIGASTGDIFDLIVNGTDLGNTSVIGATTNGSSRTFPVVIRGGNTPILISVTDLFQQWQGTSSYLLPGEIASADATLDSGPIAANFDTQALFSFSFTETTAPEPASLTLFAGAVAALGAVRRRRPA